MATKISSKIKKLLDSTQLLLASYNNKNSWHSIYPLVCKLSEQYRTLYEQSPIALQAQLNLYKTDYSYATNFVVNQSVLTCALCKSQDYNSHLTELYISVSLVEHLCVGKQLNKLSQQQTFSHNDEKIWRFRHKLAAKVILTAQQPAHEIVHILAKLGKYKHALLNTPKIMLYDGACVLISVANILAVNTTYNTQQQHISFYKAIADLYIRTPNPFTQTLLKSLVAHIGEYLPGGRVTYAEQTMVYLATDSKKRHLIISYNQPKLTWYRINAPLADTSKAWLSNNSQLVLHVWDSEHLNITHPNDTTDTSLYKLVGRIKTQQEYSFNALNSLLTPFPDVIRSVCHAVKGYNKTQLAAKDLKHSLSMVGYNNAPAIIQGVVFEQLVNSISHPLHAFVSTRLKSLVKILDLLVKHNSHLQSERISVSLYAYVYYLLQHCSTKVSRKILINNTPNQSLDTPLSAFFGIENIHSAQLNDELIALLDANPWTLALLSAEQISKRKLSENSKLWCALKIISQQVFKPEQKLTTWQQDLLKQQLSHHGWKDTLAFQQSLLALGLHNSI